MCYACPSSIFGNNSEWFRVEEHWVYHKMKIEKKNRNHSANSRCASSCGNTNIGWHTSTLLRQRIRNEVMDRGSIVCESTGRRLVLRSETEQSRRLRVEHFNCDGLRHSTEAAVLEYTARASCMSRLCRGCSEEWKREKMNRIKNKNKEICINYKE